MELPTLCPICEKPLNKDIRSLSLSCKSKSEFHFRAYLDVNMENINIYTVRIKDYIFASGLNVTVISGADNPYVTILHINDLVIEYNNEDFIKNTTNYIDRLLNLKVFI